ncbi:hypothetical protein BT96DRAFT_1047537 [Gymnopus androsaceus JB14]|uniref:Uncharacterized protein n=1 Tax=Gymnopus androsaceus JB14 TaxID=1447944 RepID=A0A6A4H9P8_9AGAR|nr:hypothetical protein BT96DRAFT_1047537 [Gymnopus androsaceus JB14]
MPGQKSPAKIAQLKALHASNAKDQPDKNTVPLIFSESTNTSTSTHSNTRNKATIASLKSELEGKVQEIDGLKKKVSKAAEDAEVQESKISSLSFEKITLLATIDTLKAQNSNLISSVARHRSSCSKSLKELHSLGIDSKREKKALQRKARDKKKKYLKEIEGLQVTLEENSHVISVLEPKNSKLCLEVIKLKEKLSLSSATVSTLGKKILLLCKTIYALEKQVERSKSSLATSCMELKKLLVWDPTEKGIYKASARKLFHNLKRAGCCNHDLLSNCVHQQNLGVLHRTGQFCAALIAAIAAIARYPSVQNYGLLWTAMGCYGLHRFRGI